MALQVWMPLTQNIDNQGINTISLTNKNATSTTGGKLGNCYSFNSSAYLYNNNFSLNTQNFSVAYWVKYTTFPTYNGYVVSLNNSTSADYQFMVGICGTSGYYTLNASFQPTTLSLNTWYHCAVTWSGTTAKMYLNGALVGTYTATVNSGATHLTVNGRSASTSGSSSSWAGGGESFLLNDLRIYDTTLSAKEVKDISRGLVVHYPLNQPERNINIINNTHFQSYGTSGEIFRDTTKFFNGHPTLKLTLSGNTSLRYAGFSSTVLGVSPGDVVTASAYVYTEDRTTIDSGCEWRIYQTHNDGTLNNWSGFYDYNKLQNGVWNFVYKTYTLDSNMATAVFNMNVVKNGTYWIACPKVEKGSIATQWCPSVADAGTWSDSIEYDSSGLKNNGSISGTLSLSSDTIRNDVCYYFNKSSFIRTPYTLGDTLIGSLSCWVKISESFSETGYIASLGKDDGFAGQQIGISFTGGTTVCGLIGGQSFGSVSLSLNTWYHLVVTSDGTTNKFYVNGALSSSTTNSGTYKSATIFQIGSRSGSASSSVGYYFYKGYMSDVRLYTTTLSASDIQELYNAPISITSTSTLMTQGEVIEE